MMKSKHNPEPLLLQEGLYLEQSYDNYDALTQSAKNWKYNCTYQLKPNALLGEHRVLQFNSMQLGYARRSGGLMQDTYTALDCISVVVVHECADKGCFHRTKLKAGDILFFDDSRPYNITTSGTIAFTVINIKKSLLDSLQLKLSYALDHHIEDTDGAYAGLMHQMWEYFGKNRDEKRDPKEYKETEVKIISTIRELLEKQSPKMTKLTKGEEIALVIRDQVYSHMDGKISIDSLAKQHNVSTRTLQISFKALFGFTPQYFLRQMKLNLVYHDLKEADARHEKVSRVAQKWGFSHMGHFSNYYTELFGENPSQTLKTHYATEESITGECVERQEEIV